MNQQPDYSFDVNRKTERRKTDGWGIAALILAIASVACCCCSVIMPFTTLILATLAIVFAFLSRKAFGRFTGLGLAALIVGIAGAVLGLIGCALFLILQEDGDLAKTLLGEEEYLKFLDYYHNIPQE